ncbi:serine/threonine protein kinase [Pseudanabaena sp. ABRG5-3]|uniref:serine/threonine protein kinase n=1 Tax=Pseudanabaena sp. ABRG5-3 TaxID=685565 RepID=UPI000DC6D2C7|nr:serine/threonine-protein kinase [Pseudanabaena sp. ABRG5-3]BBC23633.1 serine/threonine protein kinase [Pseudanabaena sp. ABRG5-3]
MTELHQTGEIVQERYRISHVLGQGGIGITYAAEDLQTGDRVALKALSLRRMNEWKVLELFEREAKVLAQLEHPAIPRYLDYFQIDHVSDRDFYIVQQLVEGRSLAQEIANGWHGSESDIKQIAEQVLDILIYLHELKPPVVHRDIKPQNLIRQPSGKIALVDFGAVQDTYRNTQIGGSTVVGTYGYMPPEQFRGKSLPATDLYALGATILFLLTGRSPADLPEVRFKIDFRSSVDISPHFANWLDKMIEPAIEDRFSSARQALTSLKKQTLPPIEQRIKALDIQHLLNQTGDRPVSKRHYEKPLGSRIDLKKTDYFLEINIPPTGWHGEGVSLLIFAICWNGFLVFWTSLASRAGFFALFSIPFWLVGIGMAYAALSTVFGKVRLIIGDRNFSLEWDILGAKRRIQGKTQDLRPLELKSFYEVNNQPVMQLCLNQGVYSHKFGSGLSRVEKEWLMQEINDFLELWRSQH